MRRLVLFEQNGGGGSANEIAARRRTAVALRSDGCFCLGQLPREWLDPESIRPMSFLENRRADTIRAEQTRQTRERFGKLSRITQRAFRTN